MERRGRLNGRTRRELLLAGAAGLGALILAGCGSDRSVWATSDGSTLAHRWLDVDRNGILQVGPGEPLLNRIQLGPAAPATRELARLAHITDAHVMDASSPARVPFLARLGPPVQSTFRPQETLTAHVLADALRAAEAWNPDVILQGGDLIDNDQGNELSAALAVFAGGEVRPGSGPDGYYGVQLASDPDPFYYRPDIDAPRHPGLLSRASRPFDASPAKRPWLPVLGDHDALVAGELVPTSQTRDLALGTRALWALPADLHLPAGFHLNATGSPDGPPDPGFVTSFLAQALAGPTVRVPADPARTQLSFREVVDRLTDGARLAGQVGSGGTGAVGRAARLYYVRDIGDRVRLVMLDLARRDGGSGGLVVPGQAAWLADQIDAAPERWTIVVSHHPIPGAAGGEDLLAVMDARGSVLATLAGHIHRNQIQARPTEAGGYWLITTASLIDYPQHARALRVCETRNGGVVLETWMLEHVGPGSLGSVSRQLAYLDAQGGRPNGFIGTAADRNVRLFRRAKA